MKKGLRVSGVIFLVLGFVLYLIAQGGISASQGVKVYTGAMVNGKFNEISSGYMGYSSEGMEAANGMQTISIMVMVTGGVFFLLSFIVRDPRDDNYL